MRATPDQVIAHVDLLRAVDRLLAHADLVREKRETLDQLFNKPDEAPQRRQGKSTAKTDESED
jgi:hypothetical protein